MMHQLVTESKCQVGQRRGGMLMLCFRLVLYPSLREDYDAGERLTCLFHPFVALKDAT